MPAVPGSFGSCPRDGFDCHRALFGEALQIPVTHDPLLFDPGRPAPCWPNPVAGARRTSGRFQGRLNALNRLVPSAQGGHQKYDLLSRHRQPVEITEQCREIARDCLPGPRQCKQDDPLPAEAPVPRTVMDTAIKEGERSLKRTLRECQKAREAIRCVLRQRPAGTNTEDRVKAENSRLARVESYILHAISALPQDPNLRLLALDQHVQSIESLRKCPDEGETEANEPLSHN